LYQTSNQLQKVGVEVTFVQFDSDSSSYEKEVINGITLLHFPKYTLKGMRLPDCFTHWLDRIMIEESDFIFHLHSVFFLPNYTVAQYLKKRHIPYIHTPHDSYSAGSMRSNNLLKRIYIEAFDKFVMDGSKAVHAITEHGAKSIARYTNNQNIKLISNFVPLSPQPKDVELKRQLCFIGRMDIYQKGIDLMLETFAHFVRQFPDVVFVLAGQYLDEEIEEFNKLLKTYKLNESQVKVMGKVSTEEKYRIMSESYAYFQLSRFEGFGLSIVEALSVGKPVIISDKVPIHDVIKQHEAGYIVTDVREAVAVLEEVFTLSHHQYMQMSANAGRCYEQNFNPESVTKQLVDMYQECL
jgi:glycosyltransferase involved in cell wall biosynthesis